MTDTHVNRTWCNDLVPNPSGTDRYLANSVTPILTPRKSVVIIKNSFNLPMQDIINKGTNMNGYILHDCKITHLGFLIQNTLYGDNMCNKQQESLSKCTCYQIMNYNDHIMSLVEDEVKVNYLTFITILHSKWFINKYILMGSIPAVGIQAGTFEDWRVGDKLLDALHKIFSYFNDKGK